MLTKEEEEMKNDDLKRNWKMEERLRNEGGRHVTFEEQERETKTLGFRKCGGHVVILNFFRT